MSARCFYTPEEMRFPMSFFIDKHNRRKTTIMLTAFCIGFLFALFFVVLSILLAEPLYNAICFDNALLTTVIHSLLIALLGTPLCCLTFLLKDKRIAPYSFGGLAVWLCMFYAAALLLEGDGQLYMIQTITMFGLAPALVGNLVAWPIYFRMKRANPTMNHRKTIREEIREDIRNNAAKQPESPAESATPSPAVSSAQQLSPSADEFEFFGPEAGRHPVVSRSAEEEAMLFYEDEADYD